MSQAVTKIAIPHKFKARDYQKNLFRSVGSSPDQKRHGVGVWHRRSGKDKTCLNLTIKEMTKRVGLYLYLFPTGKQAKKVIWLGVDRDGMRFLDHFPPEMVTKTNQQDMSITFHNGSIFMLGGTDRESRDAWMGTNPVGIVYSEYSLQNPGVRGYMRPIQVENDGWELFEYTPRGTNHGHDMYLMAKDNPDWFCEMLTVDDTKREDGAPVITKRLIEDEIRDGGDPDLIQQEYYCSFTAAMKGAYYGKQMELAEKDGRIQPLPFEPNLQVHTCWDIGIGDTTVVWFFQVVGPWFQYINYYEMSGEPLSHYIQMLQTRRQELGYNYGTHYAPHDMNVRDFSADGKTRKEIASTLGVEFEVVGKHSVEDRIESTRAHISKSRFDSEKCVSGVKALKAYSKKYDDERKVFLLRPLHDWASHPSDSYGIGVMGWQAEREATKPQQPLNHLNPQTAWMGV